MENTRLTLSQVQLHKQGRLSEKQKTQQADGGGGIYILSGKETELEASKHSKELLNFRDSICDV